MRQRWRNTGIIALTVAMSAGFADPGTQDGISEEPAPPQVQDTEIAPLDDGRMRPGTSREVPEPRASSSGEATSTRPASGTAAGSGSQAPSTTRFELIRVAPFGGVNPFSPQSLRQTIAGADPTARGTFPNSCTPGPLVPMTTAVAAVTGTAQIDIDPTSGIVSVRDSIVPAGNTALRAAYTNLNSTRFSIGTAGWAAVNPMVLPVWYPDGYRSFDVKRLDSGDHYRLTVDVQAAGILQIYSVTGLCCGTGGCP